RSAFLSTVVPSRCSRRTGGAIKPKGVATPPPAVGVFPRHGLDRKPLVFWGCVTGRWACKLLDSVVLFIHCEGPFSGLDRCQEG
ncbi:hypothetical protein A2U01_0067898, partial [Trifolium medium]|nr:hypothetical protein [Trifolium medium]